MTGKKLTKKWRLIKLSKMQKSDFAVRFIEDVLNAIEGTDKLLYRYAVKYGLEKGKEVKRNIYLKSFGDVAEFLGMISGVTVQRIDDTAIYTGCPSHHLTEVRKEEVCRGFIEGFFAAFNFDVIVTVECGEKCKIKVVIKDTSS